MNKKRFKADKTNHVPFEFHLNEDEKETHALIRILKSRHCKSLNVALAGEADTASKSIAAKTYNQVNLTNYSRFTVQAGFISDTDAFVEMEIYTGTWQEMILVETELSFTDSPFYISCNNDKIAFMIGAPGESRMEVEHDAEGGFSVLTTIMNEPTAGAGIKSSIADGTEASQVVRRLYGRMKGRINGQGFEQRQEENKEKYAENFHKTLLEGFYAIVNN